MLERFVFLAIATVCLAPSGASSQPTGQGLDPVSVIAFPGAGNWLIRIAQGKGYFAQGGIEVSLTPTPNSVFQMTNLIEGRFDIAMTAIDNVIAYLEGQGEVALSTQPDLFVFMGGSPAIPALVTLPEIKTYQELKGRTLAVDAVKTGYAFVLYDLLKRNGLQPSDYKVEPAGGTTARWQGRATQVCSRDPQPAHLSSRESRWFQHPAVRARRLRSLRGDDRRNPALMGQGQREEARRLYQGVRRRGRMAARSRKQGQRPLPSCANHFRSCRRNWPTQPTRMSSARAGSRQRHNSISRAFARCWSCAANTASRKSC